MLSKMAAVLIRPLPCWILAAQAVSAVNEEVMMSRKKSVGVRLLKYSLSFGMNNRSARAEAGAAQAATLKCEDLIRLRDK